MSTIAPAQAITPASAPRHMPIPEPAPRSSILVATDGHSQSDGALAVGRALAARLGATPLLLAVQPSIALVGPEGGVLLDPDIEASLRTELARRVCAQCARFSGSAAGPSLVDPEVLNGDPARVITRVASEREARLIVLGIGRHSVTDRVFGSETALKVARLSSVPVLAVPAESGEAPRRIVVGVDFSPASVHAATEALRLLGAGGVLRLVHVMPSERMLLAPWMMQKDYDRLVRDAFAGFISRLAVPAGVTVQQAACSGDAAEELIDVATKWHADVIAAGSHGHGFVSRVVIGSITTKLLRGARCAVLVVPPAAS